MIWDQSLHMTDAMRRFGFSSIIFARHRLWTSGSSRSQPVVISKLVPAVSPRRVAAVATLGGLYTSETSTPDALRRNPGKMCTLDFGPFDASVQLPRLPPFATAPTSPIAMSSRKSDSNDTVVSGDAGCTSAPVSESNRVSRFSAGSSAGLFLLVLDDAGSCAG